MIIASAIMKVTDNSVLLYTGKRHSDIINNEEKGYLKNCVQGFITEEGDFLNREQALYDAFDSNQITKDLFEERLKSSRELFSEDLW